MTYKKYWNWFPDVNGNLITKNGRFSLLRTDANGNLPRTYDDKVISASPVTPATINVQLSLWQRIVNFFLQLFRKRV